MSMIIFEVYEAFKEAGVSEEKAQKAAAVLANYESRFATLDNKITILDGKVNLLTWMVTFNLFMTVATLWKVFSA
jgi:hypothetical protein